MKEAVRKEELFARYGGEEFVVVLPETNLEGGLAMAEPHPHAGGRATLPVRREVLPVDGQPGVATTVGDESMTSSELLRLADERLYEAKNSGRNRVCA